VDDDAPTGPTPDADPERTTDVPAEPSSDASLADLLDAVHANLAATAGLPVAPRASPWLGEAEAVAAQAADPDASRATVADRLAHLDRLLDGAGDTDNPEADARVRAARAALDAARERLDDGET
jgi:hypothetical protein